LLHLLCFIQVADEDLRIFMELLDSVVAKLGHSVDNAGLATAAFTSLLQRMADVCNCAQLDSVRNVLSNAVYRLCSETSTVLAADNDKPTMADAFVAAMLQCMSLQQAPSMLEEDARQLWDLLHRRHLRDGTNGSSSRCV
jgi:hypothetical protein